MLCIQCNVKPTINESLTLCKECFEKHDYSDVNIGMGISDLEFTEEVMDWNSKDALISRLQGEVLNLRTELAEAKYKGTLDAGALRELINLCKKGNFDPFPGEDFPFKKAIKDLTREELVNKNKAATERIEQTKHASSPDAAKMPSYQEQYDIYAERAGLMGSKKREELSKNVDNFLDAIVKGEKTFEMDYSDIKAEIEKLIEQYKSKA